jgi:hypothetical protein
VSLDALPVIGHAFPDVFPPWLPESVIERALRAAGISWRHGPETAFALVLGTLALGAGLVFAGRRRAAAPPVEEARAPELLLARLLGGAFLAVAVLVVSRFRFHEDDFIQLLHAHDQPWEMDDSLRLVSGALLYGVGLRLGRGWFMAVNLGVWIGSVGLFHALLRRAGHARDEAGIAAALAGLAPGYFPLMRSGIGFQPSASIGLSYAILLLVDAAGRTGAGERARRAGLLSIALGLTAAGVFVKYPMVAVVPVMAWVWGKRIVRGAPPPLSHHGFYASFAAAAGVQLLLAHGASAQAGELDKAGVSALAANVANLGGRLWLPVHGLVLGAAILCIGLLVQGRRGDGPGLVRAIEEELRGVDRWAPLALLAVIAAAPFLFNARYFAPYYVVPCWAWIAALAALPLAAVARRLDGGSRVATVLAAAALIPFADAKRTLHPGVEDDPTPLLDAARRATEGRPAPCGLVVVASCPTREATAASAADLRELYDATANGSGLRWATGWHAIDVALEGAGEPGRGAIPASCAAPLTLRYCAGAGMQAVEATPPP